MARTSTEQTTVDEIIGQLDALDASNLGRIIDTASGLAQFSLSQSRRFAAMPIPPIFRHW